VIAALNLDSHSGSELTLLMRSVTTFSYSILLDVPDLSYGSDDSDTNWGALFFC
jgi:hypothetical protein